MRNLIPILLCLAALPTASAAGNEVALTLGAIYSNEREFSAPTPSSFNTDTGVALQANYGRRLVGSPLAAVFLEFHILANPLRELSASAAFLSRDYATLYLTPGLRLKLFPGGPVQPFIAAGGGYALYEQSRETLGGDPNPAPRNTHRGVLQFGGGVDIPILPFAGLRGEIRDFYTGNPSFNATLISNGQHNWVAGGGIFFKF